MWQVIVAGLAMLAVPSAATAALPPLGVNLAGCEFNPRREAAREGVDYRCPDADMIDLAARQGVRLVRLPIRAIRVQPSIRGDLSPHAITVQRVIDLALARGMTVVVDWHDYGTRAGVRIGTAPWTAEAFVDLNRRLLMRYARNPRVWIGLQNEPKVPPTAWWSWAQAATDGLRGAGFTGKLIVSGAGSSGAGKWPQNSNGQRALAFHDRDYAFDMHLYLDKNASGTSTYCKQNAANRLVRALSWAREHRKPVFLGEWATGPTAGCQRELAAVIAAMHGGGQGVLVGAAWWAMSDWMRYPRYPYGLTGPAQTTPSSAWRRLRSAYDGASR